jgi:dephospho-CoA kinase
MKRIGLTGGIGSGKSMVAELLQVCGIPVYDSDKRSKQLCESNSLLIAGLTRLLGTGVYSPDGALNREFMAAILFSNKNLLDACNKLIHPIVAQDFIEWSALQKSDFVVHESAILFETGLDSLFDGIICVTAPEALRIQRVCERSGLTIEQVESRMRNQWAESAKIERSTYILVNDNLTPLIPQVERLIHLLS